MSAPLRVRRLSPAARLPARAEPGSVGYDLCAAEAVWLPAGEQRAIGTGIAIAIPPGCYGRIAPRSGLAAKHGVDVLAGVLDPSYRGEVLVILRNHSRAGLDIAAGDRIAQLILERCETPEVVACDDLGETARGEGGFGSTGR